MSAHIQRKGIRMDDLPFTPFQWPQWVRDIAASARAEFWGLLAVSIIALILTR